MQMTGVTLARVTRINSYDTVLEVPEDISVVALSQQLHTMHSWEDVPIDVSCIMGKKSFIVKVCHQRTAMIE